MNERVEMDCSALPGRYPSIEERGSLGQSFEAVFPPATSELQPKLPEVIYKPFRFLEVPSADFERSMGIQRTHVALEGENVPTVVKDPVFLKNGHIIALGTQGDNDVKNLGVLAAHAPDITSPLTYHGVLRPNFLDEADRSDFCAPGAIYDRESRLIVVAAQTLCFKEGGRIELLTTADGRSLKHEKTIFEGKAGTATAVVYDAHPFTWNGDIMTTLNIGPRLRESAIYLAGHDGNWRGNWEVQPKPLLTKGAEGVFRGKEWNDEGSCIGQFSDNEGDLALMLSVGFLEEGEFGSSAEYGTAQRIVLSAATNPGEQFRVLKRPLLDPALESDLTVTEIGHPAWVTDESGNVYVDENGRAYFSYQGRNNDKYRWRYFLGSMPKDTLMQLGRAVVQGSDVLHTSKTPKKVAFPAG